jgi:AbrB family looped-hinge helix DNA binding protein
MTSHTTIDKAGRVVIPKTLREQFGIQAGDKLEMTGSGGVISVRPIRAKAPLRKEHGIWVYHTGQPAADALSQLIDREREKRIRDLLP